jgi:hypothetical protein
MSRGLSEIKKEIGWCMVHALARVEEPLKGSRRIRKAPQRLRLELHH